ncbi:L-seryl-tRNA(Sec) kinase-like isoform X2 [Limulus polyphemus]|uniref:L-seryl-tRNA(Sec) kinase-like isoform X2 n=1 Tax=Limulus polyphemus TaxID=6850 RepID=A0ABM1B461_LIMPO|nr:L-seryl-tRNA(Sec) kinase-like isoform X2 [Limulus polyphemus]
MDKMDENITGCICLICGIPGAGKSWFIKNLNSLINEQELWREKDHVMINICKTKQEIVSQDEKRIIQKANIFKHVYNIIYDQFVSSDTQQQLILEPGAWRGSRKSLIDNVEALLNDVGFRPENRKEDVAVKRDCSSENIVLQKTLSESNLKPSCSGHCVLFLVEDNMYYHSMRYQWFQLAKKYGVGFCQLFLQCSLKEAIQRNKIRVNKVPESVIRNMFKKLEIPDMEQNKWEKNSLIIDTSVNTSWFKSHLNKIISLIHHAAINPYYSIEKDESEKQAAQVTCCCNTIHQADNILRTLTGEKITAVKKTTSNKQELQQYAKKVNNARQAVLTKLREGKEKFPQKIIQSVQEGKTNEVRENIMFILLELLEKNMD